MNPVSVTLETSGEILWVFIKGNKRKYLNQSLILVFSRGRLLCLLRGWPNLTRSPKASSETEHRVNRSISEASLKMTASAQQPRNSNGQNVRQSLRNLTGIHTPKSNSGRPTLTLRVINSIGRPGKPSWRGHTVTRLERNPVCALEAADLPRC